MEFFIWVLSDYFLEQLRRDVVTLQIEEDDSVPAPREIQVGDLVEVTG